MAKKKKTPKKIKTWAEFGRVLRAATKAHKIKWAINEHGEIRCAKGDCPLVGLVNAANPRAGLDNSEYEIAGRILGIRHDLVDEVLGAADERSDPRRAQLLAILGLKEPKRG